MNIEETNVKNMEEQVKTINNQIDIFQTKIEKLPRALSSEYTSIVDDLKFKRTRFKNRLETFKGATDNAYSDLQTGVQLAWEDLNIAYDSAKERFEKEAS